MTRKRVESLLSNREWIPILWRHILEDWLEMYEALDKVDTVVEEDHE